MWDGLGAAATVAQLVGIDAGGLIAKIRQAARTARQNNMDCELLARRVDRLGELLPHLMRDPVAVRALAGLDGTLSEAHELVMSCQGIRCCAYKFFTASRMADRFRDVEKKIQSYLDFIPAISYICIKSRLDGTDHTSSSSHFHSQSMLLHPRRTPMPLSLDFPKPITRDFSDEHELRKGGFGVVYKVSQKKKGVAYKGKGTPTKEALPLLKRTSPSTTGVERPATVRKPKKKDTKSRSRTRFRLITDDWATDKKVPAASSSEESDDTSVEEYPEESEFDEDIDGHLRDVHWSIMHARDDVDDLFGQDTKSRSRTRFRLITDDWATDKKVRNAPRKK